MPKEHRVEDLAPEDQRLLGRALGVLQTEFKGTFDDETIEHFLVDSFERLSASAKVKTYIGVQAERFARERLKAMAQLEDSAPGKPGVLFLCVHNRINVYTGGSEPGAELNPVVVSAMAEVGVDIREEFPKPWTDEIVQAVDVVIAMGCGDVCPIYPGKRYLDWELDDPAGKDLTAVRVIRDDIEQHVAGLLGELLPNAH